MARMTRIKERAAGKDVGDIASPFGDLAPRSHNFANPSGNLGEIRVIRGSIA
jgi:hypothetical protein